MVSSDPQRAVVIENMRPLELDKPSTFVGRPGFAQAGSQLGALNLRTGQYVGQFTKDDGTEYTVALVGGQGIYTYSWGALAWTLVVTVANLTTNAITLSTTAHVYGVTFANRMVFTDGVNTPFDWDGTTGAGGLRVLTNCPVIYGKPTVYYAKLVGIKSTQRNVIVWSEEQDATIGYEQPAYNNSWALIQSDQGALVTITGTNEALYYQRSHSSAAVHGAVTTDFKADGTRAGVDEKIGSLSPGGIIFKDSRGFFLDARARPHIIVPGAGVKECWQDIHETLSGVDITAAQLAKAITLYDERTQLVLFCVTEISQSNPSCIIVFNPVLDEPVAVWRGFTFQDIAVVKDADGTPTLMHLSSDGYAYAHGLTDGTTWSDGLNAGTAAIRHTIDGAHLGTSINQEKRFTRADVTLRADANASAISFSYESPSGSSASQMASVTGSTARWDDAVFDTDNWSTNTVEAHAAFGLSIVARWIRLRIQHEVLDEQFGVEAMSAQYTPAGQTPKAA